MHSDVVPQDLATQSIDGEAKQTCHVEGVWYSTVPLALDTREVDARVDGEHNDSRVPDVRKTPIVLEVHGEDVPLQQPKQYSEAEDAYLFFCKKNREFCDYIVAILLVADC